MPGSSPNAQGRGSGKISRVSWGLETLIFPPIRYNKVMCTSHSNHQQTLCDMAKMSEYVSNLDSDR